MSKIDVVSPAANQVFFRIFIGLGITIAFLGSSAIANPVNNQANSSQSTTATKKSSAATENLDLKIDSSTPASSTNLNKPTTQPINNVKLVLKLQERRLYVYREGKVAVKYTVAVGKPGWETPTGNFKVIQMIENPAWAHPFKKGVVLPPGPSNPLGKRWVAFWTDGNNSIGFHGTPNESVMGRAVSHGCVRMRNQDVVALYEQVSLGTSVIVEP